MRRIIGNALIVVGGACCVVGSIGAITRFGDPQATPWVIVTIVTILGAGIVAIIAGFWLRSTAKPIAVDRIGNYLANVPETRRHGDVEFEVQYLASVNSRPSMLVVRMPAAPPTTIQFNEHTLFDRLAKRVGLARVPASGDAAFDNAIYARASSADYAEAYLADPKTRAAVVVLVKSGFREVRLKRKHIEAVWINFDPKKQDRPSLTEDVAAIMSVLVTRLPALESTVDLRSDWTKLAFVFLWALTILFAITGIFIFIYPPIRYWDLMSAGLVAFACAYLTLAGLAALLLRGTSVAHDRWRSLMGSGWFLIGLGAFGSLTAINALADTAAVVERVVLVVDKRSQSHARGGTSHHAVVRAWDHLEETLEFAVSTDEYSRIAPGRSQLLLLTGPGRLGIEWLKSKTVLP